MPPKASRGGNQERWVSKHKQAIIDLFDAGIADPEETSGPKINTILKSDPETLAVLQPFFSINDGGLKANNNLLCDHCKTLGCEFITAQTRAGNRRLPRSGGASVVSIGTASCCLCLLLTLSRSLSLPSFSQQRLTLPTRNFLVVASALLKLEHLTVPTVEESLSDRKTPAPRTPTTTTTR